MHFECETMKMNSMVAIITVCTAMVTGRCIETLSCNDPDTQTLNDQLNNARSSNHRHLILLGEQSTSGHKISNCTEKTPMDGDTTCPQSLLDLDNSVNTPVKDRSLCPYYYQIEHDPQRFPKSITRAVCKCNSCLENNGRSNENVCEAVYTMDIILARGSCVEGVYEYHAVEIQRQVACLCARMRETLSTSSTTASTSSDAMEPIPIV